MPIYRRAAMPKKKLPATPATGRIRPSAPAELAADEAAAEADEETELAALAPEDAALLARLAALEVMPLAAALAVDTALAPALEAALFTDEPTDETAALRLDNLELTDDRPLASAVERTLDKLEASLAAEE